VSNEPNEVESRLAQQIADSISSFVAPAFDEYVVEGIAEIIAAHRTDASELFRAARNVVEIAESNIIIYFQGKARLDQEFIDALLKLETALGQTTEATP
jgi:hypothetical protein